MCQPRAGFAVGLCRVGLCLAGLDMYMLEHCDCERLEQPMPPSEIPEQRQIRSRNRDPFNASTVKNQQPAQFYRRFFQNYITTMEVKQRTIQSTCLQTFILFVSNCISDPTCSRASILLCTRESSGLLVTGAEYFTI